MSQSIFGNVFFIYENYQNNKEIIDKFLDHSEINLKTIPDAYIDKKYQYNHSQKYDKKLFGILPSFDSFSHLKNYLHNSNIETFAIYQNKDPKRVIIEMQIGADIISLNISKKKMTSSRRDSFVIWIILMSIVTSLISIFFIKNQIRSIKELRKNAENLGRGIDVVNFKIRGAKEIRSLSISLIRMKERINRQINQKSIMLSGVSHDLRTLLTRMKLQLAIIKKEIKKDEQIKNLESDINDMEFMINEYLGFAKGMKSEDMSKINVKLFFQGIIDLYINSYQRKNINIEYKIRKDLILSCRKNNIKRVFRNIIDNSFKYGNNLYITLVTNKKNIIIIFDDDGPGVPIKDMENIFKPFYRLDSSRNLDVIGVGLGLSISQDIINSHGGQISANTSPYNGLSIKIILPL
jgi:two-component system osmolarity sensor histidine kinase EnvZ